MSVIKDLDYNNEYDIIVFCHLRWDFVYQRPQHLLTRLAKDYKMLVVEEPIGKHAEAHTQITAVSENLHVLKPQINHINELGEYLRSVLKQKSFSHAWFYSAAFVPILDALDFDTIIYDCMDELSLFKGASNTLISQETYLLSEADIVFTGGKSLYEAKKQNHKNVFCFPSSVDVDHFAGQRNSSDIPSDIADVPSPIVGYYGVIDERIDLELIEKTAKNSPDHSFVMIGPICKIEEEDLPRAKNIFYLGMKSYDELPAYLNSFDFAMMPFALNDSTKFISPTKTLEYMCANIPIISTRIKDVVREYSDCINLIRDEADFAEALKKPKQNFAMFYEDVLENTSWDKTANRMSEIIEKVNV